MAEYRDTIATATLIYQVLQVQEKYKMTNLEVLGILEALKHHLHHTKIKKAVDNKKKNKQINKKKNKK
jgi:hypothetical protein